MIKFDILTIFPDIFNSYFNESILKRAQEKKLISIKTHDLRDYTADKHKTVDDRPYGGGPGMILMVEPIAKALRALTSDKTRTTTSCLRVKRQAIPPLRSGQARDKKTRIVMLTPAGKKFTQREAERLARYDQLILLCGRYEGFDARIDKLVDEKISIGDYVLAGGELPAMVVTEAVARQVPCVVGHEHALDEETFSEGLDYIEYPQYTRPEDFKGQKVPKVLSSGNHKKIADWRKKMTKKRK